MCATNWPNWVDLVIITLVLRACYVGFGRGFLTELISLGGVVTSTAIAVNFHGPIFQQLTPWWHFDPAALDFTCFLLLLFVSLFIIHLILRKLSAILKWERIHWLIQGMGMVCGGVRGLWWAGLVVLLMLALGLPYLTASVRERSLFAPQLEKMSFEAIRSVADRFPGHASRTVAIPTLTLRLPNLRPGSAQQESPVTR